MDNLIPGTGHLLTQGCRTGIVLTGVKHLRLHCSLGGHGAVQPQHGKAVLCHQGCINTTQIAGKAVGEETGVPTGSGRDLPVPVLSGPF